MKLRLPRPLRRLLLRRRLRVLLPRRRELQFRVLLRLRRRLSLPRLSQHPPLPPQSELVRFRRRLQSRAL